MIDVVIPTHPGRLATGLFHRAVVSVQAQTVPARVVSQLDTNGSGSADTRTRGLAKVSTPWVAFLDSDDELLPHHLERLAVHAEVTGADLVYPWFHLDGGGIVEDPWPHRYGQPFDAAALRRGNYIPVTVLVRTELVRRAGGFVADLTISPPAQCDEWGLWLRMLDLGAKVEHLPERTWIWRVHGKNTQGSPRRGDAKPSRALP